MKFRLQLLVIMLCLPIYGRADSGKLFTVENGLSSSLINKIYQAKNGIIWISTEDGLNRYNGVKVFVYRHNKDDKYSINHNYVRTFFEDNKGHFFIGTPSGLQLYDQATDHFINIPINNIKSNELGVNSIIQRKNGEILVGTDALGIFSIEFIKGKIICKQKKLFSSKITTPVESIKEDRFGNLWIWINNYGFFYIQPDQKVKEIIDKKTIEAIKFCDLCEDYAGNIYIGTLNKGLLTYHHNNKTLSQALPSENAYPVITALFIDKKELYIGTDNKGLKIFNIETKKLTESNINLTTFDFSKTKVHTIIKDKRGNLWLGLYQKGVLFLPKNTNRFNYIGYKSIYKNIIGSSAVMSLTKDHSGTLWVGTDNDGIYGINTQSNHNIHFPHTKKSTSVPSVIMSIFEDSNHTIWLGSFLNGMAKFNPSNGSCDYNIPLINKSATPIRFVSCFAEDTKKNLWIGTMGDGLYSMNLKTHKITCWNKGSDKQQKGNRLSNFWINALLISKDDKLYINTCNGICCLDLKTLNFNSSISKGAWMRNAFYCFHEDSQGNIWSGSSDGLICYKPRTRTFLKYTVKNGLPNNIICAIEGDKQGYLWISTNDGLSKFNPNNNSFINYYSADGLEGNEFSKNASFFDSNNTIILGSINGVVYFKPKEITNHTRKPDIWITAFYIHNQAIKKGIKSGSYEIISTDVMNAKKYNLSYIDNSFSIEFSSLEFNDLERISYMYKLNNNNWTTLQPGTNLVSFSNLSPGTYTFKIKAKDGTTFSDAKEISIIIHPAWYATLWAKAIYLLFVVCILYFIRIQVLNRRKVKQKIMEHVQAEQINEAKLQFFINISHEIRTPMSLIISPLQKLITTDNNITRQQYYRTIYRSSERILLLVNQLLDIRKIDKGQMKLKFQEVDLVDFIEDIYATFDYQIHNKHIQFRFLHDSEKLVAWIDPKNFDKVIINLLSNAVKYTPENGNIDIILNKKKDIEIIVSNTGNIIDEKEMSRIFERFYQIQNSQNNSNIGTGIGLHLTRSIVELHHGNILVQNNANGQGCRFIVSIPSDKNHLKPNELEETLFKAQTNENENVTKTKELMTAISEEDALSKSKSKYRILVVEDDEEIRKYICNEFSKDFHMSACTNGKEALSAILKKTPDLVISDVMMPEMDGITLCRKIKQNININSIPIILLTAKNGDEDNMEGLDVGAEAYITKPFNLEILKKTVKNIIHNHEILRNCFTGNQEQKDKIPVQKLQSIDDKLLDKIMNVINRNLSNTELNVNMIASEVGLSRVHLYRKLKELTNQSPHNFIRNVRLKQAATMLSSKQYNVSETASLTGFTDIAVFSRAFKELYGITPHAYATEKNKIMRASKEKPSLSKN